MNTTLAVHYIAILDTHTHKHTHIHNAKPRGLYTTYTTVLYKLDYMVYDRSEVSGSVEGYAS